MRLASAVKEFGKIHYGKQIRLKDVSNPRTLNIGMPANVLPFFM